MKHSNIFYQTTAGEPKKLIKPVILTTIAELIHFTPIIVIFWAMEHMLRSFLENTPPDMGLLSGLGVFLIVFLAVMLFFESLSYKALYKEAYEVSATGRISLAEHIASLPLGAIEEKDPGSLAYVLMNNYTNVEIAISHKLPICIANTIVPSVVFIGLLFVNWQMAIAMFICLPLALVSLYLTQTLIDSLGSKQQAAQLETANRLQEYIEGIKVIKAYNLIGEKFQRLLLSFERLRSASFKMEAFAVPFVMFSLAFVGAGIGVMIITGRYLIFAGALDIFTFIAFLMIGTKAFVPFSISAIAFAESKYFQKAGAKILEIKSQTPQIGSLPVPQDYSIVFENVSFSYQDTPVLKNISFEIRPNQFIGITGPSGGGKSTILKLIARFYDVNEGNIYFGGKAIRTLDPNAYMEKISMVYQHVYLFADSIENNITLGKKHASQEEILEVCQKANCMEFVSQMPEGLKTQINSTTSNLSGGQKQRISIARALLKDAPIVLLDEFSAALDAINELKIQQAIQNLIQNKSVVAIAHRLKTIQNADCILYVDEGVIKESGTHAELLAKNGAYAKMWALQNMGLSK
ncbi:ABC transporter ATP-binding protein [Helicobacter sp. 11S02596-1]|uniref:ABC transporter ATP-binding protein n=1 Tax=Helicobacter sp. 11S02596-1 TaxID=1476194 RepID=UPI000BA4F077|nr:ABC transporter ATP-binding protein [Helicobacter sp. 11S02596-1]PAF44999.1 hypothetical protein BJI48_00015 [Helicobacter sp. 11S02596-1]